MNIWLIQRSEPTPHDSAGKQRAMRMGILAQMLARTGHQVLWWTSTFDHYNRRHRHETDNRVPVDLRYSIQYLRGCGYVKNMSLARLRDNVLVARRFKEIAEQETEKPDIILASIPTVELGLAAVDYGNRHGVPVLLDIRDLWPDVFLDLVPMTMRPAVRFLSTPIERKLKKACSRADGIIGITDAFVEWGTAHAGRSRSVNDCVFPMGYLANNLSAGRIEEGRQFWRERGLTGDSAELIVSFFGALGKANDLFPIVDAARLLECSLIPIKIVICGAGETKEQLLRHAQGISNLLFPGWVNAEQIRALLELTHVGIVPYIQSANFIKNIPNKPAEYFSGGAAIALSLNRGALYDLLLQRDCGFSYDNRADRLADELTLLVRNPQRLKTLQVNALKVFRELFDGDLVYRRLIEYLEQMAQSKTRRTAGTRNLATG